MFNLFPVSCPMSAGIGQQSKTITHLILQSYGTDYLNEQPEPPLHKIWLKRSIV